MMISTLEMVLRKMNNYFMRECRRDEFKIENGALRADWLLDGQYFIIAGSIFNDGLHKKGDILEHDETFFGTIAACAIPQGVIQLAEDVEEWMKKNPETDKISESFGGYSYTKSDGKNGWTAAFSDRLALWRKL